MFLYRAVSMDELEDIKATGKLTTSSHSMTGKWFAEKPEHAARWGDLLEGAENYRVIAVEAPLDTADSLFRIEKLDGIGPTLYVEADQLTQAQALGEVGR